MTKGKRIKDLEARTDNLEKALNALISALKAEQTTKTPTTEEVLDQWLNGKEN